MWCLFKEIVVGKDITALNIKGQFSLVSCSRHFYLNHFDDVIVSDKIEVINDLLETNVSCCDLFLLCNWPNFIILIQLQQIYFLCHTKKVCKITLSAVRIYPYLSLKRQFKLCKILKE